MSRDQHCGVTEGEPLANKTGFCPYTGSEVCALLAKGWQPQELCLALECEQMEQVRYNKTSDSE